MSRRGDLEEGEISDEEFKKWAKRKTEKPTPRRYDQKHGDHRYPVKASCEKRLMSDFSDWSDSSFELGPDSRKSKSRPLNQMIQLMDDCEVVSNKDCLLAHKMVSTLIQQISDFKISECPYNKRQIRKDTKKALAYLDRIDGEPLHAQELDRPHNNNGCSRCTLAPAQYTGCKDPVRKDVEYQREPRSKDEQGCYSYDDKSRKGPTAKRSRENACDGETGDVLFLYEKKPRQEKSVLKSKKREIDAEVVMPAHRRHPSPPPRYEHDRHRTSSERHSRKPVSASKEYDPPEVRDDPRPRIRSTMPLPSPPIPRQEHIPRTSSTVHEPCCPIKEQDFPSAQEPRRVKNALILQSRPGVLATMPLPPPPIPRPNGIKERISLPHPVPSQEAEEEETVYPLFGKRIPL
eukprot:TRINITY_DN9880_c0_g1_i7.p1 TRINITY_DN9880_c0_g1~~TRINITY_DN9880_c0_g1_i7.p1  ORF type:complete len:404 (+),score=89.47 TRINITY_DN9880_c0_g1_i7:79-1290(+)